MLLAPLEVRHGLLVPLAILPRHVNEFILIGEHIALVKLMDRNEFAMLVPPIQAPVQCSGFVPLQQCVHTNCNCFRTILASYKNNDKSGLDGEEDGSSLSEIGHLLFDLRVMRLILVVSQVLFLSNSFF